ncbi:MAG: hypothetical protein FIB08_11770 [Candidatus Methanoperedens sp.]|nr:hypothetical protein [Candidatus Methanoperedens sp.]
MAEYNTKMLIGVILGLIILVSGCTGDQNANSTNKSQPAVKTTASKIIVEDVTGNRTDNTGAVSDNIQSLIIRAKPDSGTNSIDLRNVTITIKDANNKYDLKYISTGTDGRVFTASPVRDDAGSFNTQAPVIHSGDLIAIEIGTKAISPITLPIRKTFWITLNLEFGKAVNLEITTPSSYGINRFVKLYP